MKKWPKAWIYSLGRIGSLYDCNGNVRSTEILDALDAAGALKEVPKPREWYIVPRDNNRVDDAYRASETHALCHDDFVKAVKVREVEEE